MLIDQNGQCSRVKPPTVTSFAAVVADSVGPIPLTETSGFNRVATSDGPEWVQDEGLLKIEVSQPGNLSTRSVKAVYMAPAATQGVWPSQQVISTISSISLSRADVHPSSVGSVCGSAFGGAVAKR